LYSFWANDPNCQQIQFTSGFFLSTFEKTQRRKNSNKTWLKKKTQSILPSKLKVPQAFLYYSTEKKLLMRKKLAFLPKKLTFFPSKLNVPQATGLNWPAEKWTKK